MNLSVAATLAPTGENLAAVLLDLLTNRPGIFQELRRLIAQIVPDIGQLEIRTSGSTMQVVFTGGGIDLNLKDLGTGVEQLLMTLVVGLTEAAPFTLVIEEPETNLHHAAQRALLGLLKDWATDRQIIAVTHSPVLLDWSPAGERLWHVTKTHGISAVMPVRDDPSVLLDALGVRLSDVLSATRVLVLEGQSDADVLGVWFPEILAGSMPYFAGGAVITRDTLTGWPNGSLTWTGSGCGACCTCGTATSCHRRLLRHSKTQEPSRSYNVASSRTTGSSRGRHRARSPQRAWNDATISARRRRCHQ